MCVYIYIYTYTNKHVYVYHISLEARTPDPGGGTDCDIIKQVRLAHVGKTRTWGTEADAPPGSHVDFKGTPCGGEV